MGFSSHNIQDPSILHKMEEKKETFVHIRYLMK